MRLGHRSRRAGKGQGRWCVRAVRGLLPDGNPLRRGSDRVEAYLLAGLFAAAVAGAPFAAHAAGQAAYDGALHAEQVQLAARHQVRAVLTQAAGSAAGLSSYVPVQATWTSVTGVRHAGDVLALPGSPKGSAVTVWTDGAGNLTSPPLQPSQVAGQADLATLGALGGVTALWLCATATVRYAVTRRRMAAWAADWEVTARKWNRQRW